MFTEKIFYQKIFNQIVDLILIKFVGLVVREPDYSRTTFLGDVRQKIEELKNWISLKGSQLHMALIRGKGGLEKAFQSNRKDTFSMGAAKKSRNFNPKCLFSRQTPPTSSPTSKGRCSNSKIN